MAVHQTGGTPATFQWMEDGALFVLGTEDGYPALYCYSLYDEEWGYEDIEFNLNAGACIAYQPNVNYNSQVYPVPGWIYLLSGNSRDFYRYAIPSLRPPVPLNGIYPGQSAVIADKTPHFMWVNTGAAQYRLQVSTNPNFTTTVIDVTVSVSEYQATSALSNDAYYWRTGTPNMFGAWTWSSTHSFEIVAGREPLTDITSPVGEGAAMAYDGDYFGHQSIIVLIGGGEKGFYEYDIVQDEWNPEHDAPTDVIAGTSLTTHDATEGPGLYPWAAFGGAGTSDNPWYYDKSIPDWVEWESHPVPPNPPYESYFPQWLGPGASMAYGPNHYQYLIVGENAQGTPRNNFYRVDPSEIEDGQQASTTRTGIARMHVVAGYDDVGVEYQLRALAHVRATLHDVLGRQVGVLDAGDQQSGMHRLSWDRDSEGRKLSAGAYFVLLDIGTEQVRLKAVVR